MGTVRSRILGLDVLRGWAALAVMLHHHGQYYDVLYPGRAPLAVDLGPGHFGVELFFIISGFVILMSVEQKKSVRTFLLSRLGRLMPTFLVTLALATAIFSLWPMPPLAGATVPQFLANLTMASTLFGQPPVDLPYWTLTYEWLFYGYMALALYFGRLGNLEWLGLALIAAGCLYWASVDIEHHRRTTILLMVHYSSFFVIGICLYRLYAGTARPITFVTLAAALATTAFGGGEQAFWAPGYIYLPLTLAFTLLVWFATGRWSGWLILKPFVLLGRISYPLYLVHVALGFEVIRFGMERGWSTLQGVIAAGLISLIAATLLHYLVEAPGMRWSRSFINRKRVAAGTMPAKAPASAPEGIAASRRNAL